jgi:hypothetical protein
MKKYVFRVSLLAAFVALFMAMGSPATAKKGDTAFEPQPTGNIYGAGGDPGRPIDIVNADFNNDGFLDLANANTSNTRAVAVRLGSGQGTFEQDPRVFDAGGSTGGGPRSLATRDLNNDTFLDLVVTFDSGTFSVLLGNGTGNFALSTRNQPTNSVGDILARDVAIGDFDRDNDPDLAFVNTLDSAPPPRTGPGGVTIFVNDGDGNFTEVQNIPFNDLPQAIARSDFNGDGVLDLAVSAVDGITGDGTVEVFFGVDPGATFTAGPVISVGGNPSDVVADDFNYDGARDIVTANHTSNNVSISLGSGAGDFSAARNFKTGGEGPASLASGDYNQDGKLDVAVANSFTKADTGESSNQGSVSILKGNAKGSFAEPRKFAFSKPVTFDVGDGPLAVVRGDYNGDSKPDLALTNSGNKDQRTLKTLSVLINATTKGAIGLGGSDSENGLLRAIEDGSDGGQD